MTATNSEPRELAKDIPIQFHVVQKFVEVMNNYNLKARSATKIELEICPSCAHDDYRAGFLFYPDGLQFKCFHTGCAYNKSAVWKKDGFVGPHLKELYRLMGGDPQNLDPASRYLNSYRETMDMIKHPDKYFDSNV
jgi:hypothetical protein